MAAADVTKGALRKMIYAKTRFLKQSKPFEHGNRRLQCLLAALSGTITCAAAPNAVLPPKGDDEGVLPNAGCDCGCPKPAGERQC